MSSGDTLVVDASVLVGLLLANPVSDTFAARLWANDLHAPAHADAEVGSALGRLHREGRLSEADVLVRLEELKRAPIKRHLLTELFSGAWAMRHNIHFPDALYVELARQLRAEFVTADMRLGNAIDDAQLL